MDLVCLRFASFTFLPLQAFPIRWREMARNFIPSRTNNPRSHVRLCTTGREPLGNRLSKGSRPVVSSLFTGSIQAMNVLSLIYSYHVACQAKTKTVLIYLENELCWLWIDLCHDTSHFASLLPSLFRRKKTVFSRKAAG